MINDDTYANLLEIAGNEVDWPMVQHLPHAMIKNAHIFQMSSHTGFMTSPWSGAPPGPLDSLYIRGLKQNLCSHRGSI